jgi:UDP-galactopyranose mutase
MILVIGAGPAGLSAAYHLGADCLVLESEAEVGGLCRSFELGGTVFDYGGHAFFTKHEYARELALSLSEDGMYVQARQAWVYSHGDFVPYPFQSNLYGLPQAIIDDCIAGLPINAAVGDRAPGNLDEWIAASFGDGIAKHFLRPYNEKLWAHPLNEIAPSGSERIVTPDVEAITAGARGRVPFTEFPNVNVGYPRRGGFANVWGGFERHVGDRIRRACVESIDLRGRTVTMDTGEPLAYDRLVSTMPLTELVRRAAGGSPGLREAAGKLRHNSLHLVNIVVGRPIDTERQRVYAADPSIPFHKLVLNSNSSPDLRERPVFGIQAEVSWSPHKPVDPEALHDRVLSCLIGMGIVTADDPIVASSLVTVEHAYPVYTPETAAARSHIFDELAQCGVECAGRFGEWLYINSDDAVMRGKAAADRVEAELTRSS